MVDFIDFSEVQCGPMGKDRDIDRMFLKFNHEVGGTVPPLETDDSERKSNHKVAFMLSALDRAAPFECLTYSYRYFNRELADKFGGCLACKDWADLAAESGSNAKT